VNGTRKQTKKEDKNKLTTLAFKIIPIFHNTLLATTKIKFFLGLLPMFGAHQQPNNQNFYGPKLKFYSGEICPFGEAPKRKCYSGGFCPFWGPTGAFWGSGPHRPSVVGVSWNLRAETVLRRFNARYGGISNAFKVTIKLQIFLFQMVVT
jgi:hypothetical protein